MVLVMARYPIRVTHGTMKRLKSLAISPNESYDKILTRILDAKIGEEIITYLIDDVNSNCKLRCVIDYSQEVKNIVYYERDESLRSPNPPLVYVGNDVSSTDYSNFLMRLRGVEDIISVLAMLGRREYTVVNNIRLIRI